MNRMSLIRWVGGAVVATLVAGAVLHLQSVEAQTRARQIAGPGSAGGAGGAGGAADDRGAAGGAGGAGGFERVDGGSVAANNDSVFVLLNQTLYQYTANDLTLRRRVRVEPAGLEPEAGPPARRSGR